MAFVEITISIETGRLTDMGRKIDWYSLRLEAKVKLLVNSSLSSSPSKPRQKLLF